MNESKTEVLIIGAGLTGLSTGFWLKKAGIDFRIIEKENRTGGVINTVSEDGFVFETGPNTGVLSSTELVQLCIDLGDSCTLDKALPGANKRYIMKNGRWRPLPSGLFSAIGTPLFSWKDKFRILGEPFRKPGNDPDETVAGLVRRRLGNTFLDYAVNPFISGVYAGDPERLVTRFALPKLYNLEQNYGSFIKGSIAKAKQQKTELEKKATKEVFSAKGGLGNLIKALTEKIGEERILTGASGTEIQKTDKGYLAIIKKNSGDIIKLNASKIVITTGAYSLQSLLPFVNHNDISKIQNLEYAKVVQVSIGYKKWDGMKLDAFGGLVPEKEKRKILGILFPSAIFKDRAPESGALLSVFLGGMRDPGLIEKSDTEITAIVLDEVKKTLFNEKRPDLLRISRYMHAIPQYEKGSGERFESIRKTESEYPGLILAGNIRDGIGMSDRVKQAKSIADLLSDKR
ncbi:MAG TPA: protoporphyrinogen oxidase [Bacteroidales bacterium]|nr:protoporphyrinogen oxidase [Bacteroidales bacterium]